MRPIRIDIADGSARDQSRGGDSGFSRGGIVHNNSYFLLLRTFYLYCLFKMQCTMLLEC